jgi:hypothetical protein
MVPAIDLIATGLCFAGIVISAHMLSLTVLRRKIVRESGQNGEMKIVVWRSFRCELIYLLIHIMMAGTAIVAMTTGRYWIPFFCTRAFVSVMLFYSSVRDLMDRKKLEEYYETKNSVLQEKE